MNQEEIDQFNEAIPVFMGVGVSSYPKEDEHRLIDRFGLERATPLMQKVSRLLDELDEIDPDWEEHDLSSGGRWAVARLKERHPYLNEEAMEALWWAYTWWRK